MDGNCANGAILGDSPKGARVQHSYPQTGRGDFVWTCKVFEFRRSSCAGVRIGGTGIFVSREAPVRFVSGFGIFRKSCPIPAKRKRATIFHVLGNSQPSGAQWSKSFPKVHAFRLHVANLSQRKRGEQRHARGNRAAGAVAHLCFLSKVALVARLPPRGGAP